MHLAAITDIDEIVSLVKRFRWALTSAEQQEDRKVGNPSSTSYCCVHVHRDLGFWVVLEDSGDIQSWHVFGQIDDRFDVEAATLAHVCQVNFSYEQNDKVAGLFARDSRGRIYVTHSGGVGGGRKGIGKTAFLEYVAERAILPMAEIEVDGLPAAPRLVLSELDTPSFRRKLAAFVRLVAEFKSWARGDSEPVVLTIPGKRGQGYERDPEVRRAVEEHAMATVTQYYTSQRYTVERVSNRPGELDLRCTRRGVELLVEVKGTTGDGDTVELTDAEVRRARAATPPVHLAVLSGIRVDRSQHPPRASGGTLYLYKNFDPAQHLLIPTRYRCKLEHGYGELA